ncbi:hypothetical protein MNBD_GAMMA21-2740 [hydrothermal vent metagenome]|uniref:Phospholipid/glycerol acyltransferase domain-containing protein n=1 Tax=hydrothermal vent metagenome TaxID=652676 RepID=A0A3B1AM07_9ZZZZ
MLFRLIQDTWQGFCRTVVAVFYRRVEIDGLANLPETGAVLLCANHANALADAVILQAVIPRLLHPVARSGLFKNWLLKPFMLIMQAVPIYRRQDKGADMKSNLDAFECCYEMFEQGEVILLFPEGQSHSDPGLRKIKSGAARMILGSNKKSIPVTVLPVGLTFSNKGKFRSNIFIKLGEPVVVASDSDGDVQAVRELTVDIQQAIESVTINVDEADDLDFLKGVERFFAMRHGKYRHRNMALRFQALQKINHAYLQLREFAPQQLSQLKHKLHQYERLCDNWKINAYQVTIQYTPSLVTRFILRSLLIILVVLPVGIWGIINSYIPFILTRHLAKLISKDRDQYDTSKMVLGLSFFPLFWAGQIWWISSHISMLSLIIYIVSLPVSAAAALFLRREQHRILDNLRVFFLFIRKRKLKKYLENRRQELERELARLVRLAKQIKVSKSS